MSRRVNCHDNAVAESFFHLLKWERVKKRIYATRESTSAGIFDHIERSDNSTWKHEQTEEFKQETAWERLVDSLCIIKVLLFSIQ